MNKDPQIVIIEDDDDIRQNYTDILESEGFKVAQFRNGKDAIEGLRHFPDPCLIFLDLMMPVMDGWQFLEQRPSIRDAICAVPVYIVSALAEKPEIQKPGVRGYMKKPVDIDVFIKIAEDFCGKKQI